MLNRGLYAFQTVHVWAFLGRNACSLGIFPPPIRESVQSLHLFYFWTRICATIQRVTDVRYLSRKFWREISRQNLKFCVCVTDELTCVTDGSQQCRRRVAILAVHCHPSQPFPCNSLKWTATAKHYCKNRLAGLS